MYDNFLLTRALIVLIVFGRKLPNAAMMCTHFLLSAQARTLSLASVARLSEQEARDTFRQIRWAATNGEPVCPRCGCLAIYEYASRPIFKCKGCGHQFSVTSGTIFASRKRPASRRSYLRMMDSNEQRPS